MPRLAGKESNDTIVLYVISFAFIAIVAVGVLEYLGAIDLVPNFGKSNESEGASLRGTKNSLVIKPNRNVSQ